MATLIKFKYYIGGFIGALLLAWGAYTSAIVLLPPSIQRGDILVATSTSQLIRVATGSQGSVLMVNNNLPAWTATSSLGFISSITLNGLTGNSFTLTSGTPITGLDLNITNSGSTITFSPQIQSGYTIPTSTLINNLSTFYTTPSTQITAGLDLIWNNNTLNSKLQKQIGQGYNSVTIAASSTDDSSVGTIAWSNPGNATSSNDVYATATIDAGETTHYLKATNFGFSIPTTSQITGIVVEWEKKKTGSGSAAVDNAVRIVKGGTIGSTDKSQGAWLADDNYSSYGSYTDLWGETWTAADINAANFGAALSARETSGFIYTLSVDHVRILVYYNWENQNIVVSGVVSGSGTSTIVTTFGAGNFATGTAGNIFNIATTTTSLTINCPVASASVQGCLSSADWTTFNNKEPAITVLPVSKGGIGTTTLGNLTVSSSNLSITGGQQVLIGTSTQITLTGTPSFTTLTVTATSTLASTTVTNLLSSTLTAGKCVQAAAGGLLTSAADACGSGGSGNSAWTIGDGLIYNATSTDEVGVGTATPTSTLHIQGNGTTPLFEISSSTGASVFRVNNLTGVVVGSSTNTSQFSRVHIHGDASAASVMSIPLALETAWSIGSQTMQRYYGPAIPAGNDMDVQMLSLSDAGTLRAFASWAVNMRDKTNGSEDGDFIIRTRGEGALADRFTIIGVGRIGIASSVPTAMLVVQGANVGGNTTTPVLIVSTSTGVSLFQVNANGNVGIATSTPQRILSVVGSTSVSTLIAAGCDVKALASNGELYCGTDADSAAASAAWTLGLGLIHNATTTDEVVIGRTTTSTAATLTVQGSRSDHLLEINSSTGVSLLRVSSNGSLLISTTTPSATLMVQGTSTQPALDLLRVASSTGILALQVTNGNNINIPSTTATALLGTDANKNLQSLTITNGTNVTGAVTASTLTLGWTGDLAVADGGSGASTLTGMLKGNGTSAFTGVTVSTFDYVARWSDVNTIGVGKLIDNNTVGGYNATSSTASFLVQGTTTLNPFQVNTSTGISLLRLSANGSVGIGTTTNSSTLFVQGTSTLPAINPFSVASSSGTTIFQVTNAAQILADPTARLTIPQGSAPTISAVGDIGIDTSNGGMIVFHGGGGVETAYGTTTKSMLIESPTASESLSMFIAPANITITMVRCSITSSVSNVPSWTFGLPHGTSRATTGLTASVVTGQTCTSTTTPQSYTSFIDATLAEGEFLVATSSAVSNASTTMLQIYFKYDR